MNAPLRKDNLPSDVTTLVGRRRELDATVGHLSEARLVTLVGIGGVGKTRLSLAVGHRLRRAFDAGVWLVELAELSKAELLPVTIMHTIAPAYVGEAEDDLIGYVGGDQMLLILDNCEHLAVPIARLVDQLLRQCPNARVLATSREPLRVSGEVIFEVPSLSEPPPGPVLTRDQARTYESIELFCERAAAAAPWFVLREENLPDVVALCRHLDGLPLAIELAAMGMRTLTPAQLLARYESMYQLLVRGSHAAPVRHQTLRAAVNWSHDLCSEPARILWARMSQFAGAVDLTAAEQVCGFGRLDEDAILPTLGELVDKSILSFDGAQYRMLETIRQYGRERLVERDELEEVRERLFHYVYDLGQRNEASWFSAAQPDLLREVRRNLPNIRRALEYCETTPGRYDAGLRTVIALWSYWIPCGQQREGRHWLDVFLGMTEEPTTDRVAAHWVNAYLLLIEGSAAGCHSEVAAGIQLAERIGDRFGLARNVHVRGLIEMLSGDIENGLNDLRRSVALEREREGFNPYLIPVLNSLGSALCNEQQVDEAVEILLEAEAMSAAHGEQWMRSWSVLFLGLTDWIRQQPADAVMRLRDCLEIKWPLVDLIGSATAIELLAWASLGLDDPVRSARLLGGSAELFEPLGEHLLGFTRLREWSDSCIDEARNVLGEQTYLDEFETGRHLSHDQLIALALDSKAVPPSRPRMDVDSPLTKREHEIAALVAEGKTNREIARNLVISQRTVDGHVERILAKLGLRSRTKLAVLFTTGFGDHPNATPQATVQHQRATTTQT
jgi:non-specific serine/threonine protein kinase